MIAAGIPGAHRIGSHTLPDGWGVAAVGDLFAIRQGKALSPAARNASQRFPFLRTANVFWGHIDATTVDLMGLTGDERRRLALRDGDLLVCEGGDIGRCAIWHDELSECYYQNHLHRLRPLQSETHPDFYAYWFHAAFTTLGLYEGAGNKTTIPNLSRARLAALPVPVPPAREQERVARVLSTIQRSRARSAEILHDLNRLRASSLHKLFENDGGSNEVLLGDMVTLQRGYDLPSQDRKLGEVPVVSSSGVSGHHCSGKEVGPGVVIGRYGTLGQVHFIEAGPYWPLNTTLFVKDFHENDPRFVAYFLETIAYESHNDKTSVPGINRNDLHALRVLWPSKADQSRIARVLSVIDRRIAAEEATGLRLGQIFASAAAALLGGAG